MLWLEFFDHHEEINLGEVFPVFNYESHIIYGFIYKRYTYLLCM